MTADIVERLPQLVDEVAELLAQEQPGHATFIATSREAVLEGARRAVEVVVMRAAESVLGVMREPRPEDMAMFEYVGVLEWRYGHELPPLLSAYQLAARTTWRHLAVVVEERGVSKAGLIAVGEALFTFVNDISSATARGYLQAQSDAVVTRERFRTDLVEQLLSGHATSASVRTAAASAGWTVPEKAALVVDDGASGGRVQLASRLDATCLPVHRGELSGVIVPNPDAPGRPARLAAALRGLGAVVGPTVLLDQLPRSISIIETARRLSTAGILRDDPLFVDERLEMIVAHRDPALLEALRTRVLAPLEGCRPSVRWRLEQTLTSWVRHWGDRRAVAEELHIHPQTVRYRVRQVHELFGEALDDPDVRARLTLALAFGPPAQPAYRPDR